jgi:hypothetical protein
LIPPSLRSLPVALRPYPDEGLTSWLSRTGGVYGCTAKELLAEVASFDQDLFEQIDLQMNRNVLRPLGILLSASVSDLEKCTLARAHPEWLDRWIIRTELLWHVTEHRTIERPAVLSAVCPLCLLDDLRTGRSQYGRLAWYCSILTICPVHRTRMVSCCSPNLWHLSLATRGDLPIHRSCCLRCRRHLDSFQSWGEEVDEHALSALIFFEAMLRDAIISRYEPDAMEDHDTLGSLVEPIRDLAWALMRPVARSSQRALHFLQTPQFKVPPGLSTPVESSDWLASGPIELRRSLLAVIASLILPASMCRTLTSEAGRGMPFWTKLRTYHSPEDRTEFSQRAAKWSQRAVAALDFYR